MQACSECTTIATAIFILQAKFFSLLSSKGQIFLESLIFSFLHLSVKEQYFNKFRKLVRSTCLHFHFDPLSQTFDRRDIHLSESVLQMCNNGSYRLKIIAGCYLSVLWKVWLTESKLKYTHVLLTNLWTCWSTALLNQDLRKKEH